MSKHEWGDLSVDSEIYDIARGLYDSKVNIKRPPSAAQHSVYSPSFRGPPVTLAQVYKKGKRPYSAKARILTSDTSDAVRKPRLPWRPFSGHAALNRPTSFLTDNVDINKKAQLNINTASKEQELHCDLTALPIVYHNRSLPKSILGLSEWLTVDIPEDWPSCYKPQHSFVFLPCVRTGEVNTLPGVPPVQQPEELLISDSVSQVRKYKPPKPRFRQFFDDEDRKGKHNCHKGSCRLSQITSHGSSLILNMYEGKRTVDIIRQEIKDLERLLKGIGNPTGSSIVVQYQHDINHLRNMLQTILDGCEFDENTQQCLTPVATYFQENLMSYAKQHEQILKTIKQQRDQCVQELADIECEIMKSVI